MPTPSAGDDGPIAIGEQETQHQALLDELQQERSHSSASLVYHYTNDVGLFEIMRTGHLWLSDYTTLNDPTELKYGVDIGVDVLNAAVLARGNMPGDVAFVAGFNSVLSRGVHSILRGYVLSLSVEGDELTQWRSYANGGTGYCIGFDANVLDQALIAYGRMPGHQGYGSFEVLYDEPMLRARMARHVAVSLAALARIVQPSAGQLRKLGVDLLFAMLYTALYFKHSAYRSEREYRILLLSSAFSPALSGMLSRARRNEVVEYLAMDWKSAFIGALQSIMIGPAAHLPTATAFISKVQTGFLPSGFPLTVSQSTIPFRV